MCGLYGPSLNIQLPTINFSLLHLLIRPPKVFLGPLLLVELAKPDRGGDAAGVACGGGVLLVFVVSANGDYDMIEVFAENLEDSVDRLLLGLVHGGK